jgi:hypothetical protein
LPDEARIAWELSLGSPLSFTGLGVAGFVDFFFLGAAAGNDVALEEAEEEAGFDFFFFFLLPPEEGGFTAVSVK